MSIICPTVLASEPHAYRDQVEKATSVANRIQVDLMDGIFTPTKSVNPIQVWWPEGTQADVHLMFARPTEHIETLVSLMPHMVIIHAEAEGDLVGVLQHFQKVGIKAGVALLKETSVESARALIAIADHVLVFSGDLGSFGGHADLTMLLKVPEIKVINPTIEIGWDGGANESNVAQLADGGIDVINVGGGIQKADDAQSAYDTLVTKLAIT
ncbi:hypothetical protein H7Y40_01280 [Pedobacter sp.]|nr:hypothetical protein [Candidatus Saccharibacteria bacterium]